MRLITDGATPVPRLVLLDEVETDDGYVFELDRSLFLAVGDRIGFEGGGLAVVRSDGHRVQPAGSWSTRCKVGYRRTAVASS